MKEIIVTPFDTMSPGELTEDDKKMQAFGIMKTIYVPPHPYVKATKLAIAGAMNKTIGMYDHPQLRGQDRMHGEFFETYIDWSKSAVDIQSRQYPYQYPTSGSSEAIRETIAHYANNERAKGRIPQIHVFDGEYEGYAAYATAHRVEVITHSRENYSETLEQSLQSGQRFYMSTPSGIDGNIWRGYEGFLQYIENQHPTAQVMLDLAYLNTTAQIPNIRTDSPVVEAIFVSMSKSFTGTYYDRIGGVLSRSPIPGLYGNQWFKDLGGLLLGKTLMENSPLGEIPAQMRTLQLQVVEDLKKTLGNTLQASDVTFVATRPIPENMEPWEGPLTRAGQLRYCLTPALDTLMNPRS